MQSTKLFCKSRTITLTIKYICHNSVYSDIQWLKFVDNAEELIRRRNQTINVNGQQYVVLSTASVISRPDGSYSSKLDLHSVAERDTGTYLCLATNSIGFSFLGARITVLAEG